MLKASGREDAQLPPEPGKVPVLVSNLLKLYHFLSRKGPKAEAVKDIAIVAFWGMARLVKVTYKARTGTIPQNSKLMLADVQLYDTVTVLTLHKAKTAKPGETQILKLRPMKGLLFPVKAIEQQPALAPAETDPLFGYGNGPKRIHLTKCRTNKVLREAWTA